MVADQLEPLALLGGERPARRLLLGEPVVERARDLLGERDQLVLLVEREADQRDDVGQRRARRRRGPSIASSVS